MVKFPEFLGRPTYVDVRMVDCASADHHTIRTNFAYQLSELRRYFECFMAFMVTQHLHRM
jgi:hypothetical protein